MYRWNRMNYLKDIIMESEEKKIDKMKIKYYMPEHISPYLELNEDNLNLINLDGSKENLIGVNPYFRNEKIFWDFMSPNIINFKGLKDMLFNIICHLIAETDYFYIKRVSDFEKKMLEKAILSYEYGEFIKNTYFGFSKSEKEIILEELLKMYKIGSNMERFLSVLNEIFMGNISYDYLEEKNTINMFLSQKENETNIKKLEFLKELFLPINLKLRIYWEYHFLIIGVDETSKLDNCKIF